MKKNIYYVVTPRCAAAAVVSAVVLRRPTKEYTHPYSMMHHRLPTAGIEVAPHYHQLLVSDNTNERTANSVGECLPSPTKDSPPPSSACSMTTSRGVSFLSSPTRCSTGLVKKYGGSVLLGIPSCIYLIIWISSQQYQAPTIIFNVSQLKRKTI